MSLRLIFPAAVSLLLGLLAICPDRLRADETSASLTIERPVAWQVVQRRGSLPVARAARGPDGVPTDDADVVIELSGIDASQAELVEARLMTYGAEPQEIVGWLRLQNVALKEGILAGTLRAPAGGWYRLEVRAAASAPAISVEPIGVGEVLIVAGQSYAAGANDELMKVTDSAQRVSAYDPASGRWQPADDPQPGRGDGGTIWPPLGDHLAGLLGVPIGFVNVAVGGTASRQWLPGETLYQQLVAAARQQRDFRAVLWQQGESDVIENVTTDQYIEHLVAIRNGLEKELDRKVPWLLAKSTLHPTVYDRPEGEAAIRLAVDRLVDEHAFQRGPDTDQLDGENRGGLGTRRHFTGIGQRRAALLWLIAIWNELERSSAP